MPSGESVKLDKRSGGSNRQRLAKSVAISLLMPITVSCTALTIYFGNASELGIDLPSVLRFVSVFFVLTSLLLLVIQLPVFYLWKGKAFPFVNACLLMAGVWLWMEANVFVWDMGTSFDFTEPYPGFRHIERGTLYIGTILTLIFFRRIYRFSLHCSAILIAAQLIGLFPLAWNTVKNETDIKPNFADYEITLNQFFDYSKKGDVYVFVLDMLGATLYDEIDESIKTNELFKDFTLFPQQIAFSPVSTVWAMPKILSGLEIKQDDDPSQMDKNNVEQEEFFAEAFSSKTLFDHAIQNGYDCQVHSWFPSVYYWDPKDMNNIRRSENISAIGLHNLSNPQSRLRVSRFAALTFFRFVTFSKKNKYYWKGLLSGRLLLGEDFSKRMFAKEYVPLSLAVGDKRFFDKSRSVEWNWTPDQKQMKFMHLEGAHAWRVPGEATELPLPDKAKLALKNVHVFLEQLKKIDNYDSSLIVIMSDHGVAYTGSYQPIPTGINKPLLLVKRPGDAHDTMQVNTNPTCVSDTKNAIMTELDWSRSADAFSWFEVPKEIAEKRNVEWTEYLQEKTKLR